MTQPIRELCLSYKTLLNNIKLQQKENDPTVLERLHLVNQALTDATVVIDDLNHDLLQDSVNLTDQQREELNDMSLARETLKVFSPYIMWYNIYRKSKDLDVSHA